MNQNDFDLLTTVEQGGCSAKLDPAALSGLLNSIPLLKDSRIMVDIETHDDAGVYRLNESTALIVTTDFFPPVCSSGKEFGQIAAANSLSDIYAMGGTPLLALNLTMFPSTRIPLDILRQILEGGQEKINEAGAFTMGGHTIDDYPPKYGLAVIGTVHPEQLITNSGATPGQSLILTKPLGTGILLAAHRLKLAPENAYIRTLAQMKQLNDIGAQLMHKYHVKGATDITGFGLLGHALKMADASGVSLQIDNRSLPAIESAIELIQAGCIPGATFRNLHFVKDSTFFSADCITEQKILACDAQTSGGLLIAIDKSKASDLLNDLQQSGKYTDAKIIGEVIKRRQKALYLI